MGLGEPAFREWAVAPLAPAKREIKANGDWYRGVTTMSQVVSGTRKERFLVIRDLVLAHTKRMKPDQLSSRQLRCGPFLIAYNYPGRLSPKYNLQIWPGGAQDGGHIVQGDKVANVDWDQYDNVEIISYRSGPWEQQLVELLSRSGSLTFV
jgi:hypothetical protein